MARVFVSSTFQDLKEYRQAVYVALRRLGHQSVAMEDYVATDQPPLEKSLDDLRHSDVAVFIIAWRYGYIPAGQQYSMTEIELRTAREACIPCLIFLVADSVPWEEKHIDTDSTNIRRFRDEVLQSYAVAFFTTPEELAMQVAVSQIPLRFRRIQAADLVGWHPGAPDTQGMQALISAIGRCVRGNARGTA